MKKMKIKLLHLYYDILNIYGENGNMRALVKALEYQGLKVNVDFKTIDDEIEIPVQVNGKVKGTVSIALDTDEAIVKEKVHENQSVKNAISDKNIVKEIYIKNKIYNIVVK